MVMTTSLCSMLIPMQGTIVVVVVVEFLRMSKGVGYVDLSLLLSPWRGEHQGLPSKGK
ncbi:MAG: hypothetical protein RL297_601 [Pseudomonadota bacterium]